MYQKRLKMTLMKIVWKWRRRLWEFAGSEGEGCALSLLTPSTLSSVFLWCFGWGTLSPAELPTTELGTALRKSNLYIFGVLFILTQIFPPCSVVAFTAVIISSREKSAFKLCDWQREHLTLLIVSDVWELGADWVPAPPSHQNLVKNTHSSFSLCGTDQLIAWLCKHLHFEDIECSLSVTNHILTSTRDVSALSSKQTTHCFGFYDFFVRYLHSRRHYNENLLWREGISLFVQISGALVHPLLGVEFKTSVFKLINWHYSWGNKAIFLFLILTFHEPVEHTAWKWNMCAFLNPSVPDSPIKVKCEGWLLQMMCWSNIKQLKILSSFIIAGSHMLLAANKGWFK